MFKNIRGNSIIEVMVVIIILTIGITGTYNIINSGQKLSVTSENRIKAINIAREGLEAIENIRDTNWIKFSSDYTNCWNVKNYDVNCIWVPGKNFSSGSYVLTQSWTLWLLSGSMSPPPYSTNYSGYLAQFPLFLDVNGLVTSSESSTAACNTTKTTGCRMIYTREIQIANPDIDHLKVNSIVTWKDSSRGPPYIINLETILTNWKKKF